MRRETGIQKETLRAWERRYGFPHPARDATGERVYSQAEIDKLKLMKKLTDRGHRPSAIVSRTDSQLRALLVASEQRLPHPHDGQWIEPLMRAVKAHDVTVLRNELSECLHRQGLELFVNSTVAPLNSAIGALWVIGELEIHEEHLYSELVQSLLREAIQSLPVHDTAPRVVLTTPPGEQHQLGLLMAHALFALERAQCVPLGARTPLREVANAAVAHRADVVALSLSASFSLNTASQVLYDLDELLPEGIEIWAGGAAAGMVRNPPTRVRILASLNDIRPNLQNWRAHR